MNRYRFGECVLFIIRFMKFKFALIHSELIYPVIYLWYKIYYSSNYNAEFLC